MATLVEQIDAVDRAIAARSDLTAMEVDFLRGLNRQLLSEVLVLIEWHAIKNAMREPDRQTAAQGEADGGYLPVRRAWDASE